MPRKRTHGKRRLDAYSGAEAWSDVFETGYAFFDDFTDATGVEVVDGIRPARSDIEAAWLAYGPAFLALYDGQRASGEPVWALQQFGEPPDAH